MWGVWAQRVASVLATCSVRARNVLEVRSQHVAPKRGKSATYGRYGYRPPLVVKKTFGFTPSFRYLCTVNQNALYMKTSFLVCKLFLVALSCLCPSGARGQSGFAASRDSALYYDSLAEVRLGLGRVDEYLPLKRKAYYMYNNVLADSDKVAECCIYFGNYYNAVGRYDSAVAYLTRMDRYARLRPRETSYNIMLTCLADTYYRMGMIDSAVSKEQASARYSLELGDTLTLLGSYRALGMYHRSAGRLPDALHVYGQALALVTGNAAPWLTEERASLYVNLSVLCFDMKQTEDALRYARLACADLLKVDNELATVQAYSNLSMVFMGCGDLAAADTCLHRSMASAVRMGDANMQLRNLGYMLHLKDLEHKPDSVDYYMKQARRLVPQVEATNTLAGYYQTERDALLSLRRYREALATCHALLAVPGVEGKSFILEDTYKAMATCLEKLGRPEEAYDYMERYVALTDSLMSEKRDKALQELNVKYETKEKELRIAQIEGERRLAEARHRTRLFLLCLLVVVLVQVTAFIILWMKKKTERMRLYAEQQAKAAELLRSETELKLTRQYLEGVETERNRLAMELHDGISNDLYALEIKLQSGQADTALAATLNDIRENVRAISHELMPPSFSELTLKEIVQTYVGNLADSLPGMAFDFCADPPDAPWHRLPQPVAIVAYRVIQEALGNVVRHAAATRVYIGIELAGTTLLLYVKDNGQVFHPHGQAGKGIGLLTMRERVEALHGSLDILPGEDEGTLLKCTIPVELGGTDVETNKETL